MSTRLNTHLRAAIVLNALFKSGVTAALAALDDRRAAWAEAVRQSCNGVGDEALDAMCAKVANAQKEIPAHLRVPLPVAIRKRDYMYVNVAGLSTCVQFPEMRYIPGDRGVILADNPLAQQFHDIEAEAQALTNRKAEITETVKATLSAVTTIAALLKAWPEAKELLPANLEEAKAALPALTTDKLNALIGLPTEQAA